MLACPKPSLHQVEGAPIQALADLLRTATEFDEVTDDLRDTIGERYMSAEERRRCDALRAAVRALQGPATGGAS